MVGGINRQARLAELIADGRVHPAAMSPVVAVRKRIVPITDAMQAAGCRWSLYVVVKKCRCAVALSVPRPVGWRVRSRRCGRRNMVELDGATPAEAIHMASRIRECWVLMVFWDRLNWKRASVVALIAGCMCTNLIQVN